MRLSILPVILVIALTGVQAHAVTYVSTGQFDDGTTWNATAVFQESAMADMKVFIDEMDSFTLETMTGPGHPALTMTEADASDPTIHGLEFDGVLAGANVIDAAQDGQGIFQNHFFRGEVGDRTFKFAEAAMEDISFVFLSPRFDVGLAVWTFVADQPGAIPEPTTAALSLIGMAGLLTRRKRPA